MIGGGILAVLESIDATLLRIEQIAITNSAKLDANISLLQDCLTAILDQPTGFRLTK